MGTRSRIGVMHGTVCKSVYCHWDGGLAHNGRILQEHYDAGKAEQLIALGNMSSLGAEIGKKHDFGSSDPSSKNWCTFYGRDRDDGENSSAANSTFDDFFEGVEGCFAEWYYVMQNGQWYCGNSHREHEYYKKLVLLGEALETAEDDAG